MLYCLRLIVLLFWGLTTSMIGICISIIRPFHPNNSYLYSRIFAPIAAKILGLSIKVFNQQILGQHRPAIIVSNHQHNIDLIMGCYLIPPNTVSMGKKSMKYLPFFGQFYWLAGNILIDRFNREKAMDSMDKVKNEVIKNGVSIWIMPEGTRNKFNKLKKFKKGAFLTAIHAQVPIIPVAISTFHGHLNYNKLKSGNIFVEVLPPIPTKGLTNNDVRPLVNQVQKLLESKIASLDLLLE